MMQKPEIDLLLQHLQGKASPQDVATIEHWRGLDAANEEEFQALKRVWEATGELTDVPAYDLNRGWQRLSLELGLDQKVAATKVVSQTKKPVRKRKEPIWLYVVAASALFATVYFFWSINRRVHRMTAPGEQQEVVLADGTKVWLDGSSKLSYPQHFADTARVIWLEGHAFFEVASEHRAFIVKTETARVQVTGTAFDVWAGNGKTRVVVKEGSVSLKRRGGEKAVALGPDQFSECSQNQDPLEPAAVNVTQSLAWMQGDRSYFQQPLEDVLADLGRFFGKTIVLEEPAFGSQTLTASFGKATLPEILDEICLALSLKCREKDGMYFLTAGR